MNAMSWGEVIVEERVGLVQSLVGVEEYDYSKV
jgi:hypothetical protein